MNDQLQQIFLDLAKFEYMNKRSFPGMAFQKVADALMRHTEEIKTIEQLRLVPNVGKSSYDIVSEFLDKGYCQRHQEAVKALSTRVDAGKVKAIEEITSIKGFGGAIAEKLYNYGIRSRDLLLRATKDLKPGEEIGKSGCALSISQFAGLQFDAHSSRTRMTVEEHDLVANPILEQITAHPSVTNASSVGSRRRYAGQANYTIGDIDIIICTADAEYWKNTLPMLDLVVMSGPAKVSGIKDKRQVDFRFIGEESWGSMLLHATGSKNHNIKLRTLALQKGYYLSEYGLKDQKTGEIVASKTEQEIFDKLGIAFVPPQNRSI